MSAPVTFNNKDLLPAYNDVLNGGETNYALYTLISTPTSNELKLVSSGTGGLQELEDEFQDGKVMWAFVRVQDPGSGLSKFVLVNWVGDGVPERQKGMFPTHSRDVTSKLLRGAHVTIQARDEADVVPSHILKRVADSSGSKYSVHNEPKVKLERPEPVQSSYKPIGQPVITPSRVIAPPTPVGTAYVSKRDELASIRAASAATKSSAPPPSLAPRPTPPFAQEEKEIVGGGSSYASKRDELAQIRKTQEGLVGKGDDFDAPAPRASAPASSFPSISLPPRPTPASSFPSISLPTRPTSSAPGPTSAKESPTPSTDRPAPVGTSYTPVSLPKPGKLGNRWAQAQTQPKEEEEVAAPVARATPSFARPAVVVASAGAAAVGAGVGAALTWSQRQALAKKQETETPAPAPVAASEVEDDDDFETPPVPRASEVDEEDEFETPAPPPPPPAPLAPPVPTMSEPEQERKEEKSFPPAPVAPPPPPFVAGAAAVEQVEKEEEAEVPTKEVASLSLGGPTARVLFAYQKDEDNEMELVEGEILTSIEMIDEGWWSGKAEDGREGLFPANYVELIEETEAEVVESSPAPPPPPPAPPAPAMPARPTAVAEPEPEVESGPVAIAMYGYDAAEEGELSFAETDRITGIEFVSEEWWQGVAPDGSVGVFPANYVELQE